MRRRSPVLALALMLALWSPAGARAADAQPSAPAVLGTRAALHGDFARLVFEAAAGGKLVPFTASSDGDTLTIRFAEPVAPGLDTIRRAKPP